MKKDAKTEESSLMSSNQKRGGEAADDANRVGCDCLIDDVSTMMAAAAAVVSVVGCIIIMRVGCTRAIDRIMRDSMAADGIIMREDEAAMKLDPIDDGRRLRWACCCCCRGCHRSQRPSCAFEFVREADSDQINSVGDVG